MFDGSIPERQLPNDPTWERAFQIASKRLAINSNATNLIRGAWRGFIDNREYLRLLGFSRFNVAALFEAAEISTTERTNDASLVEQVINYLGPRYCSVVLAINHTCQQISRTKPPNTTWNRIAHEMMTNVEIGYKFGNKAHGVGVESGMLMGFVRGAGLGLLMADDQKAFKRWYQMTDGYEGRKLLLDSFGCEPYQVAAAAVQILGFGSEMAFGAAMGVGALDEKFLNVGPEILGWKATFLWIEALRHGRSYPAKMDMRDFFPELSPPKDPSRKNTALEVLYTEIAGVRRTGSAWRWHFTNITSAPPAPAEQKAQQAAAQAGPAGKDGKNRDGKVGRKELASASM